MATVAVVFGTRPEAIKLAPVVLEMRSSAALQPLVCVTGQHRQMLDPVLAWFGIQPDHDLGLMQPNQQLADFAARALTSLHALFAETKPAAVVIQGDTTSAMIAALAAFYHRIPVAHVEAGLRTGELYNPFPEEMNRRVAGVLTRFHFPPASTSEQALLREGIPRERIFAVGNTVVDALRLTTARLGDAASLWHSRPGGRVLVTAHRRESFGSPFEQICLAIRDLADSEQNGEIVYPVHLNPNVRDPVSRILVNHPRIRLVEPMRYEDFVHLMSECDLILTDSGGIQEEATVLGKTTLVLRDNTERPEAVESGTARLVGTDRKTIVITAREALRHPNIARPKSPFGDGYAARRIVEVLTHALT